MSDFVEVIPTFIVEPQDNVTHINKVAFNKTDGASLKAYQAKITSI